MGKRLQITVDDGPLRGTSGSTALDTILAEISRRGLLAAFFVLGQEVRLAPADALKIVLHGHVLGNHSWDHLEPHTFHYGDDEIIEQFQRTHDEVQSKVGYTMKYWRAPRLEQIPRLQGLLVGPGKLYEKENVDAHADSKDSDGVTTAAGMLGAIRNDIETNWPHRRNLRLLFHVKDATANALPEVLDGLIADGHELVNFEYFD